MKQIRVDDIKVGPQIKELPIPTPGKGEVLMRVVVATIMPVDRMMSLEPVFAPPYVIGPQGSGVIVGVGEGVPKDYVGKKAIVCSSLLQLPEKTWVGMWSQYVIAKEKDIYIFNQAISHEQASGMYVAPLCAMGTARWLEKGKFKAVIQSAACSEICKKVAMMLHERGVIVINLVRGPENVAILKGLGEELVLDVKDPKFEENMKMVIEKYKPDAFLDSVVDMLSQKIYTMMPPKSTLCVFGLLGGLQAFPVPVLDTLVNEKVVAGYYWSMEDFKKSKEDIHKELDVVNEDLAKGGKRFGVTIAKEYKLEDYKLALDKQASLASKGRCLLRLNEA